MMACKVILFAALATRGLGLESSAPVCHTEDGVAGLCDSKGSSMIQSQLSQLQTEVTDDVEAGEWCVKGTVGKSKKGRFCCHDSCGSTCGAKNCRGKKCCFSKMKECKNPNEVGCKIPENAAATGGDELEAGDGGAGGKAGAGDAAGPSAPWVFGSDKRTPAGAGDAPAPRVLPIGNNADEASSYVVSGAGADEWNGVYSKAGTAYGAPQYNKDEEHSLYRYDGVWRLAVKGKWTAYDAPGVSSAMTPPSSAPSSIWVSGSDKRTPAGRGDAPAPWFEMGADEAYVVSGAGSAEWNGLYSKAGTAYGAPLYTKDKEHSLYRYDGVWRLAVKGKWTAYDAPNHSGAKTPPSDTKSGSAM